MPGPRHALARGLSTVLLAALCALAACTWIPTVASGAPSGHLRVARHAAAKHAHARPARCRLLRDFTHLRRNATRSSFHSSAAPRRPTRRWVCWGRLHRLRHHARRAPFRHRHTHALPRAHHVPPRVLTHHTVAAASGSTCADADLTPNEENLDRVRAATLCLINRERAGHGENPLAPNGHLEAAAQGHTEDMVWGNYFDHVGPRGDTPASRMRSAGYMYGSQVGYEVGENIGWGTLWLATPRAIVAAWMASPGHRANILDGNYRDTAIGISPHPFPSAANGQPGAMYTQDFGVVIPG